jgi:hypothetical protein
MIPETLGPVYVGARDSIGDRNPFNCIFDEIAVLSRALSSDEIMSLYKRGTTKYLSDYTDHQ